MDYDLLRKDLELSSSDDEDQGALKNNSNVASTEGQYLNKDKKMKPRKKAKMKPSVEQDHGEGDLVLAKYSRYTPWPALVVAEQGSGNLFRADRNGKIKVHVMFIEDRDMVAWVPVENVQSYLPPNNYRKKIKEAVKWANNLMNVIPQERVKFYKKYKQK